MTLESHKKILVPEAQVLKAVLEFLNWNNYIQIRINPTRIFQRCGQTRFAPISKAMLGCADIITIIRGKPVAIECKSSNGKQSAAQVDFQKRWEASGGVYILCRSRNEVINYVLNKENGE